MNDWYMEIIDCRGQGAKTGEGAAYATEAKARVAFNLARFLAVPERRAAFLLDLHNPNGDLLDTILLDAAGFEAIVGKPPQSAEVYASYDKAYWQQALAQRAASRQESRT